MTEIISGAIPRYYCPEVNCDDTEQYPYVNSRLFDEMRKVSSESFKKIIVFPFLNETCEGDAFVDVYFWDCSLPGRYTRFVIRNGYRLSGQKEDEYLEFATSTNLWIEEEVLKQLYSNVNSVFPEWHFARYKPHFVSEALEHLLYVSYWSGCKEILYKADLNMIAYNIDYLPKYNEDGSSPTEIVGYEINNKLLRILNQRFLIHNLYYEETIDLAKGIYNKYSNFITELPNIAQWNYLEELYCEGNFGGQNFNSAFYRRLSDPAAERYLGKYRKYFMLSRRVFDYDVFRKDKALKKKIPRLNEVENLNENLEEIIRYKRNEQELDPLIKDRKKQLASVYEYSSSNYPYACILPESCMDICAEAMHQHNCLLRYVVLHAHAETTIVFIRLKERAERSFAVIEVECDNHISQVFCADNMLPERKVFEFLEEYCLSKGFDYNPMKIIMDLIENDYSQDISEDLWDYISMFQKDYEWRLGQFIAQIESIHADDPDPHQFTLEECFPGLFGRVTPEISMD